ncbi:sulfite exporter TauE/SafE family protein [Chitinasiproducens palmae]|uniref:Probable membrane transporter protein n=1 Tax=Chitinasiproducens palmae TaxID=1770053 RepID=A0A1H2PQE8_9BURK|nr:sulfite exporter TauE/SafE family protein [Chitinasiproducens palmae]SDV49053.1 hypothetical protein SAMN05216551_10723 [Chitinasiproducens palmae]
MTVLYDPVLPLVCATFLLAGVVKGVTGMGLPTVAMGILGTLISPAAAAAWLILPSLLTNLWQCGWGAGLLDRLRRFGTLLGGIVVGTLCGAHLLASDTRWTSGALGFALLLYALYGLFSRPLRLPAHLERWLSPVVGLITGLVTGVSGVFVIPAVPYLQSLDMAREDTVRALGLAFTASTLALGAGLAEAGAFGGGDALRSAIAIVPALAGMWLGQEVRRRISAAMFRRCFFGVLLLLAAHLLLRFFSPA